jgi:hypothetical protein
MQPNQNNEKIGFNAMHAEELGSSLTNWLDEEDDQVAMEMKRQSAQMSTTAIANNGSATWDRNVATYHHNPRSFLKTCITAIAPVPILWLHFPANK